MVQLSLLPAALVLGTSPGKQPESSRRMGSPGTERVHGRTFQWVTRTVDGSEIDV